MAKQNMSFLKLAEITLERANTPLSSKEIWDKAHEFGTIGDFKTAGKTPWASIGARCYTEINEHGSDSIFIQTSERPAQFFLRRLANTINLEKVQRQKNSEAAKREDLERKKFCERDMHPLLVSYANGNSHFKANLKTIFHEASIKTAKGKNEWLHPDIVGVYFPFQDYKPETLAIQNSLSITSIKLFSFELKIGLDFGNLRQSYFQAVSNSSWANEGYLVALHIDEDSTFSDELRRLNNAFGIGIIQLNAENVDESEILFPSRINQEIDWDTVNRLARENKNFEEFLKSITEDCKLGKVKSSYDPVFDEDRMTSYIMEKTIK